MLRSFGVFGVSGYRNASGTLRERTEREMDEGGSCCFPLDLGGYYG